MKKGITRKKDIKTLNAVKSGSTNIFGYELFDEHIFNLIRHALISCLNSCLNPEKVANSETYLKIIYIEKENQKDMR